MHRFVAAFGAADRIGAAGIVGRRPCRVLLRPLRLAAADRMDRRKVQHVEAHGAIAGRRAITSSKVPWHAGQTRLRTRKELIPAGESRGPALHVDRKLRAQPHGNAAHPARCIKASSFGTEQPSA